jgi:hypothetical protein
LEWDLASYAPAAGGFPAPDDSTLALLRTNPPARSTVGSRLASIWHMADHLRPSLPSQVSPMGLFSELEGAPLQQRVPLADVLDAVRFDAAGLVPAIAQAHDTREVLMLAWMNRAALEETLATGRVCYYSRSR